MKRSLLAIAAVLLAAFSFAQPKIGLQLYSFREQLPKDPQGMLKKIASWGIVELEGGDSYGVPREQFRDWLRADGLKMISIGASFEELDSTVAEVIERAHFYGASYVMCAWIPHTDFDLKRAGEAAAVFNRAGKALLAAGIRLCSHTHGFEFVPWQGKKTLFDYLVAKTNQAYVNFEMDVYWVKMAGQDPVVLLNRYPARFKMLHLKDRLKGTKGDLTGHGDDNANVVLGSGDVGIAAIMRTARKIGVKHYFIEDESPRSEQQVPESLAFLKGIKY